MIMNFSSSFVCKARVCYFFQIFIFLLNDTLSKTVKNVFISSKKANFILEIFKLLLFFLFLSTLSRCKRTNGRGIVYDVLNWLV